MNRSGYVVLGLLAMMAIAAAVRFGYFGEETRDQATGDETASSSTEQAVSTVENSTTASQSAVEDDGWRIYCTGRIAPIIKIPNQDISNSAVFFALKLRDNETPERDKMLCQTEILTAEFVERKYENWEELSKSYITFKMPYDDSVIKIAISSIIDFDKSEQIRKLNRILNVCDSNGEPDSIGIFYYFGKKNQCTERQMRNSSNIIYGYSIKNIDNDDISFLTCTDKCLLQINFNNRLVRVIFLRKLLSNWKLIHKNVLSTLKERVVLHSEFDRCFGELCSVLEQKLK